MKKHIKIILVLFLTGVMFVAGGCNEQFYNSSNGGYWDSIFFNDKPVEKKTQISILYLGSDYIFTAALPDLTREVFAENGITAHVYTRGNTLSYLSNHYNDFAAGSIPDINQNKYDIIIMQAIYTDNDAKSVISFFNDFKSLGINSKIILMPYHDEPSHTAKWARDKLNDIGFTDWRGVVSELYNKGFADFSLKADDWLSRPTIINGYFGVLLLYIRMFDTVPLHKTSDQYILSTAVSANPDFNPEDPEATPQYLSLLPGTNETERLEMLTNGFEVVKSVARIA